MDPSGGMYMMPAAYGGPAPPPPSLMQQQQQQEQQQQMVLYGVEIPNRVFVGGCPYNMTEMELSSFFTQFGEVRDSKIITDRDGGKSKGYGFVTFAKEEDAVKVHSMGSIYYQQKKLNVSKAVRKYGGQYQKANQEYVNGQKMLWMHPNGFLLSPQDNSWNLEQFPSHTQQVKPYYPMMGPHPMPAQNLYYNQPNPYQSNNAWIGLGQSQPPQVYSTTTATAADYSHSPPLTTYQLPTTTTGKDSLESSGSSTSSEHHVEDSRQDEKKFAIDMKLIDVQTKQLSLDSAYTSEADLDASHNSTATNSRAASPKLAATTEKAEGEKTPVNNAEAAEEKNVKTAEKEKEKVKAKPLRLVNEFVPGTQSNNHAVFYPSASLIPSAGAHQLYLQSQQYISPPLSPLAIQIGPQQQPCFTYFPTQAQIIPAGNPML